jgi:head-tail adaptor
MAGEIGIGDLDTLVTVQRCEISTGDRGQKVYNWKCVRRVYAHVDSSLSESVDDGNLGQDGSLILTMYKVEGMTARWRVIVGGKTYAVDRIDPISRISPLCEVGVSGIE